MSANLQIADDTLLALISGGDCSKLSAEQKLAYYKARCDAAGLDYRSQPFQFLTLQGKTVLYALKGASDQLAASRKLRISIVSQKTEGSIRVVTVKASTQNGCETEEIGCVSIENLRGEALSNAFMKAVTKAKRRAILSICGLGMLDETEIDSIPGAVPEPIQTEKQISAPHDIEPLYQAICERIKNLADRPQDGMKRAKSLLSQIDEKPQSMVAWLTAAKENRNFSALAALDKILKATLAEDERAAQKKLDELDAMTKPVDTPNLADETAIFREALLEWCKEHERTEFVLTDLTEETGQVLLRLQDELISWGIVEKTKDGWKIHQHEEA